MTVPGDEYIIFTPYFPEYKVFVEAAGGRFVPAATNGETFQIDFDRLEAAVNEHTKGIFVNSPNNPSGVVFTEESILRLAAFLESKEKEYGHTIYLIADEPYRELVYGDVFVPYLTKYYRDTVVCYSYSKSLSMPGERIGYILVPDEAADAGDLYAAVCGAGRALGYVCAPSMAQHVIARCQGMVSDLSVYRKTEICCTRRWKATGIPACIRMERFICLSGRWNRMQWLSAKKRRSRNFCWFRRMISDARVMCGLLTA